LKQHPDYGPADAGIIKGKTGRQGALISTISLPKGGGNCIGVECREPNKTTNKPNDVHLSRSPPRSWLTLSAKSLFEWGRG